jgi:NADP-dependent 3-hydroxy acid dehydrogenase YdfG
VRNLKDRVAVVTGAGSGLGRALAIELARRGCDVALTDRDEARLVEVAQAIAALGRRASAHTFDVADRQAWPPFVEAVLADHGRVHLVVNNAGVSLSGPFARCSLDDIGWQLGVNVDGVVHGCHFLLPILQQQEEGHIVNISSIFGLIAMPENSAYCMSKHAVRALTEVLEMELWGTSVRVTSVHPGAVATRIAIDGRLREGGAIDRERAHGLIARGMPPERAAQIVADGIQADRRRIVVGRDAKLLELVQWLAPLLYRNLLVRYYNRARAG